MDSINDIGYCFGIGDPKQLSNSEWSGLFALLMVAAIFGMDFPINTKYLSEDAKKMIRDYVNEMESDPK